MSENKEMTLADEMRDRKNIIIKTSVIGIVVNILLSVFKMIVGTMTGSIAVTLDAVNNLSDALSSVITIVGAKLAGKLPDKKHPLGYGRVEYLSAMIVSAIVLYAGITSVVESVKKIIHPEAADYTTVSLVIIGVSVIVKLILGRYVSAKGRQARSGALEASGADASFDAILSLSVFASAVIFIKTGLSLEAYVGAVISVIIIKSGIEMMIETLDDILGRRADAEETAEIKRLLNEEEEVRGAYDLILNNYGPNRNYGSVHLELPDTMTVEEVDVLTRKVQQKVYKETGVILTGIGVYSYNTKSGTAAEIRNRVQETVLSHEWALQMHGFYADLEKKVMRFDVVMSFDADKEEAVRILYNELAEIYPEYKIDIALDADVSDI